VSDLVGEVRLRRAAVSRRRAYIRAPRPQVDALALPAEQGQVLHRLGAGVAEPVGHEGVELGRLPAAKDEVVLAQDQP